MDSPLTLDSDAVPRATLWGGGFSQPMHPALAAISDSLIQDLPLADADMRASAAYAQALVRCGVLRAGEGEILTTTLAAMREDLAAGRWIPAGVEDIHTAIEAELVRRAGELGERIHTGRSRNDQVATAFRLAVCERGDALADAVRGLQRSILRRAEAEIDTLLPAYTHLQRAQPTRLAHWLLAHFWPLQRDVERLGQARQRVLDLPLGSGAATGNPFGVDRAWLARELGFRSVAQNSLDAVGDRDFAAEILFSCALLGVHLSRLAEEMVLWSTAEFGFLRWPDPLATGSSLMPNKRNPDLAELVRGRSASLVGDLTTLLVLLKGLPASYQRDLQEDKPPVWRATATVLASLQAMRAGIEGVEFDRERMGRSLTDELLATDAADLLVRRGVTFRKAHGIVARAVAEARRRGLSLRELAREAPDALPEPLRPEDVLALDFEAAIEWRTAVGGTARAAVESQLLQAEAALSGDDA